MSSTNTLAAAGQSLATFALQGCGSAGPGSATPAVTEPQTLISFASAILNEGVEAGVMFRSDADGSWSGA